MSGNKEDTLRHFCDVTGADENRSRFFLESSNWQLEARNNFIYNYLDSYNQINELLIKVTLKKKHKI